MYITVSPFFMINRPKVQCSALESIVPVWADLKSVILDISVLFFSWSSYWKRFFKWTDCFFLFDSDVWNPFIMKTTVTSDLS